MKFLFIGGTGTISSACTSLALARGHEVYLLNRGNRPVPQGAVSILCDIGEEARAAQKLEGLRFDAVVDFIAFRPEQVERDIRLFAGKTDQYVFISTASAYQKPAGERRITESTPLRNPYWQYSRDKIACEDLLVRAYRNQGFPATIIRPSHTYCQRSVPVAMHGAGGSWQVLDRIRRGKPVPVHGDGLTWWTFTFHTDFAVGLVGLLGNIHAVGEAYHITSDEALTWNMAYHIIGSALGAEPNIVHVSSDLLIRLRPDLEGPLLGDKANSVLFDNTKIRRAVPDFNPTVRYDQGVRICLETILADPVLQRPDPEFDDFCDRVAKAADNFGA